MAGGAASGVHDDNLFELDGNAVDETKTAPFDGDDWSNVYAAVTGGDADCSEMTGTIAACSFAEDAVNGSIFTGGGSKDEQEVQTSWKHTDGAVPAKDDLLHAYAAQYDNGNLYFGADRYATNGDAQIGFWFFHNEISLNSDGTFSGVHTAHDDNGTPGDLTDDSNGDILILSNFSNGGTVPNIRVFEWYGVDDVRELPGVTSALCAPTLVNDKACAITSSGGQASPWDFKPKSGAEDIFGNGAFYEGGIDLVGLGFGGECFSTFLAETRSSTSITATLKDFVLGQLGECGVGVTTAVEKSTLSIGAGTVYNSDDATITGTGLNAPPPSGDVDFYLCGPTAGIQVCTTSGTKVATVSIPAGSTDNPVTVNSGQIAITAAGDYCFHAVYLGDDNYPEQGDSGGTSECFTVTQITPTATTAQAWLPNDSATINSGGGASLLLSGTARFELYASADCGAAAGDTAVYAVNVPVSGAAEKTVSTANTSYVVTATGETRYSWKFSYTSLDTNQLGIAASCKEVSTLTIDNDNTVP